MKNHNRQSGFSAVELLITLFIASVFLITGFQLYAAIIKNSGEARQQATAANVIADYLQRYKPSATNPCTVQTPFNASISVTGLSNVTMTVSISCPPYVSNSGNECTGGTITHDGLYTVHKFTTSESLACPTTYAADVLVVSGGGGGGADVYAGGGGGGGGYLTGSETLAGTMPVVVGDGGLGAIFNSRNSTVGGTSSFGIRAPVGGGRGGGLAGSVAGSKDGGTGGSGGGGKGYSVGGVGVGGSGTGGQGNNGGAGYAANTGAGGGGGQSAVGAAGSGDNGGAGGGGINSDIILRGTNVGYAGGGGGGGWASGGTATFGGGAGNAAAGTPSTGGGGGGCNSAVIAGYDGGSGVVVIRYLTPQGSSITSISKVSVTLNYGNPQQSITNATYVKP